MSSFHLISRYHHIDDFAIDLFSQCLEKFQFEFDAFYFVVSNFEETLKLIEKKFTKKHIILCLKDNLEVTPHGYWIDRQPQAGSIIMQNFIERHPDRQFIIISTMENLGAEIAAPNVKILTMLCDGLDQRVRYRTMVPCLEKNMDSNLAFICLNRHNRLHRITTLSYLLGRGLDQYGIISCICTGPKQDFRHPMMNSDVSDEIKNILEKGIDRLYETEFDRQYDIFEEHHNNNFLNFNKKLRPKYCEVFVEIVSEPMFSSLAYTISEKSMHAMHGCCFPIILNGSGAIAHMREVGYDMFDDIINHDYDQITNSVQRIITAIDSNERLLSDVDYAKKLWTDNLHRFEHNAKMARIGAETFYVKRFWDQIDDLVKKYPVDL